MYYFRISYKSDKIKVLYYVEIQIGIIDSIKLRPNTNVRT